MPTLVQSVMGEVIGETEEIVPQEEVLVVFKVVGVVSVVDPDTVKDVGVDVEGGLVVGEVGPVVVLGEVGVPVRTLWVNGTVHLRCRGAQPAGPVTEREQLAGTRSHGEVSKPHIYSPGFDVTMHTL